MVFLLLVYIRTEPITLPCSLARAGNNYDTLLCFILQVSSFNSKGVLSACITSKSDESI